MAFETILFEKHAGIATVTMNRPDKLNAMTWRMIEEFLDAVEDCRRDDTVRVLVFTGAGRAFLVLAAVLVRRFARTGGPPMLRMMNGGEH